jgi:hypothetical protein
MSPSISFIAGVTSVLVVNLVRGRSYLTSMNVKVDGGGRTGGRKNVDFTPETFPVSSAKSHFKG